MQTRCRVRDAQAPLRSPAPAPSCPCPEAPTPPGRTLALQEVPDASYGCAVTAAGGEADTPLDGRGSKGSEGLSHLWKS